MEVESTHLQGSSLLLPLQLPALETTALPRDRWTRRMQIEKPHPKIMCRTTRMFTLKRTGKSDLC